MFPFQNWRGVCGDFCPKRAGLSFDGSDDIVLPVAGTSFPAGLGFRRFLVARLFLGRELPFFFDPQSGFFGPVQVRDFGFDAAGGFLFG